MAKKATVHIGTSGWHYAHWKGPFYPEDLPDREMLSFFLKTFKTVEINNSFYHLPAEKTVINWRETVPADFVFAVKASRYITHRKKLKDPERTTPKFFDRIKHLGDNLGPILFHLPPRWKANPERLAAVFKPLPKQYRYSFEFRDHSWFQDEIYDILARHSAAFCIYDFGTNEIPRQVTADFVYIRFHGPGQKYSGLYTKQMLKPWA